MMLQKNPAAFTLVLLAGALHVASLMAAQAPAHEGHFSRCPAAA